MFYLCVAFACGGVVVLGWSGLLFANCCVFELAVRVVLLCACFVC